MIDKAILYLKENGIESFERMGILVIPVSSEDAKRLDYIAKDIKRLLEKIGYDKSWSLDPYYYERHKSLEGEMYK
jgi:hypothetical protein